MPIRKTPPSKRAASEQFAWEDLAVLLAVSQTGNMSQAATRLNKTQPTISRALTDLEKRLGATLVERAKGRKGVTLTDLGKRVAENAAGIERLINAIYEDAAMRDLEPKGEVTIACNEGLGAYVIAGAISSFHDMFPDISLDVRLKPDGAREPDITIQSSEEKRRMSDVAVPLGWMHYVHFASSGYIKRRGGMKTLQEAFDHRMLTQTSYVQQYERWRPKVKSLRDAIDHAVRTDDSAFLFQAVAGGAGVAAIPSYAAMIDPHLQALDTGELARIRFWLVHDQQRGQLPRVRAAITWLCGLFDARSNPWFREEFIEPREFAKLVAAMDAPPVWLPRPAEAKRRRTARR